MNDMRKLFIAALACKSALWETQYDAIRMYGLFIILAMLSKELCFLHPMLSLLIDETSLVNIFTYFISPQRHSAACSIANQQFKNITRSNYNTLLRLLMVLKLMSCPDLILKPYVLLSKMTLSLAITIPWHASMHSWSCSFMVFKWSSQVCCSIHVHIFDFISHR